MLCTCLCNKAGHHGICQETADLDCVLAYQQIQLYTPGAMCRRCYVTVLRTVYSAVRDSQYDQGEGGREVAGRAGSGLSQRG